MSIVDYSEESVRFRLKLLFWYLGFAVEMHTRWVERLWLTKPMCACHPDVFVRY